MGLVSAWTTTATRLSGALSRAWRNAASSFDVDALMKLGEPKQPRPCATVSTGSATLDAALEIGGLPRGRLTGMLGAQSTGKTTLALQVVAAATQSAGLCAFIDVEHGLSAYLIKAVGLDASRVLLCRPRSAEQALETCARLLRSGAIDVIVLDSLAALLPRAELEGRLGHTSLRAHVDFVDRLVRTLDVAVRRTATAILLVDQTRGRFGCQDEANPQAAASGDALRFHAAVCLALGPSPHAPRDAAKKRMRIHVKILKNGIAGLLGRPEVVISAKTPSGRIIA